MSSPKMIEKDPLQVATSSFARVMNYLSQDIRTISNPIVSGQISSRVLSTSTDFEAFVAQVDAGNYEKAHEKFVTLFIDVNTLAAHQERMLANSSNRDLLEKTFKDVKETFRTLEYAFKQKLPGDPGRPVYAGQNGGGPALAALFA